MRYVAVMDKNRGTAYGEQCGEVPVAIWLRVGSEGRHVRDFRSSLKGAQSPADGPQRSGVRRAVLGGNAGRP